MTRGERREKARRARISQSRRVGRRPVTLPFVDAITAPNGQTIAPRRCDHERKLIYPSRAAAWGARNVLASTGTTGAQHVYPCRMGDHWHLTSRSSPHTCPCKSCRRIARQTGIPQAERIDHV
jgi:hypothetical protein